MTLRWQLHVSGCNTLFSRHQLHQVTVSIGISQAVVSWYLYRQQWRYRLNRKICTLLMLLHICLMSVLAQNCMYYTDVSYLYASWFPCIDKNEDSGSSRCAPCGWDAAPFETFYSDRALSWRASPANYRWTLLAEFKNSVELHLQHSEDVKVSVQDYQQRCRLSLCKVMHFYGCYCQLLFINKVQVSAYEYYCGHRIGIDRFSLLKSFSYTWHEST